MYRLATLLMIYGLLICLGCSQGKTSALDKLLSQELRQIEKDTPETTLQKGDQAKEKAAPKKPPSPRASRTRKAGLKKAESTAKTPPSSSKKSVRRAKALINAHRYEEALDYIGDDPENIELRYYKGIAYFALMQMNHRFKAKQVKTYRDRAIVILKDIGQTAERSSLQARALLWYAVALHVNYSDNTRKAKALKALETICSSPRLQKTYYYGEALLFSARIYEAEKQWAMAEKYYDRLEAHAKPGQKVYDFLNKQWYATDVIAKKGLKKAREK